MNQSIAYQENSVLTQNKGKLVVMLYDGAIKYLNMAITAINNGNMEDKGKCIVKAQDIIFELNTVLDMETGGEIAANLRKLYNFMWQRLSDANIKSDSNMIIDVVKLLTELNKGWKAISQ